MQTAHTHSSRRRSGKETLLDVGRISTLCTLIIIGTLDKDLVVLLFLKDMVVNYLNIILLCPPPMVMVYVKHVVKTSGTDIESGLVDSFSPSPSLGVR